MSIAILQAFNCRCLEIFVHDIYFFLFISKPRPNGIRACLILIQETRLICFIGRKPIRNKEEKIIGPLYLLYLPSASADGLTGFFRSEILTSDTQLNPHQHTEPSSLDLLGPVSTGHYTVFFRPVSTGHYTVFAFKMASMALWYSVKSTPTARTYTAHSTRHTFYIWELISCFYWD